LARRPLRAAATRISTVFRLTKSVDIKHLRMARRRKPLSGSKNSKSLTKKALAKELGISRAMLYKLIARGMPVDSIEAAKEWRRINLEPKREPGAVTSEVARLKSAQAEAAELDVAQKLGKVIPLEDVRIAISEAMVIVGSQLDGLGGRCAAQLAVMTDAAEIRRFLLNETRRIRAAAADRLKGLGGGTPGG
jgi:hypothetical protein